jgi:hypothetical protein
MEYRLTPVRAALERAQMVLLLSLEFPFRVVTQSRCPASDQTAIQTAPPPAALQWRTIEKDPTFKSSPHHDLVAALINTVL